VLLWRAPETDPWTLTPEKQRMSDWLPPALAAAGRWLEYQQRASRLPGLQFAVAHRGQKVADTALGVRSRLSGEPLTTDSRLRVASHSKTFTAVGIMRLVETGRLRLDDKAGSRVAGLHADTAETTIAQLLTHTAGLTRDGGDAGQWQMRRPFLNATELRQALAESPVLSANTRFKYSNHSFGLLGLIIEEIAGEPYVDWIAREVIARARLTQTTPDGPLPPHVPFAGGHGVAALLGDHFEIDNGGSTGALASATGFVSTASDLVQFYSLLPPDAADTLLDQSSRREMTRRHWRVPDMTAERHYGLGLMHGGDGDWAWFGHGGAFPGCLSHTSVVPAHGFAISVIVNAVDVAPISLVDGVISILRACALNGAATPTTSNWSGRFWSIWGAVDLLPVGDRVLVTQPAQLSPLLDAVELIDVGETTARIGKAHGFSSHGEGARLELDAGGRPGALWLGGSRLLPEAAMAAEVQQRFRSSGNPA
jgi:CubicO group peptidase (beta-lactamase class C family)